MNIFELLAISGHTPSNVEGPTATVSSGLYCHSFFRINKHIRKQNRSKIIEKRILRV